MTEPSHLLSYEKPRVKKKYNINSTNKHIKFTILQKKITNANFFKGVLQLSKPKVFVSNAENRYAKLNAMTHEERLLYFEHINAKEKKQNKRRISEKETEKS